MRFLFLTCLGLVLSQSGVRAADPIKPAQFDRLHALIRPQANEDHWMRIPWQIDLWEARKKAAAEGKPILLWEMDGNPLGCV